MAGFKPNYKPSKWNRQRAIDIQDVLARYHAQTPLTVRQIFYILVSQYGYDKTESESATQQKLIGEMRRGGYIDFKDIHDEGFSDNVPLAYADDAMFYARVREDAAAFRLERQAGQQVFVELWCEAVGMVPQLVRVALDYGVPVYSGGGFPSITSKFDAADRIANRDVRTVVLHIGDHDWSGDKIFKDLDRDVTAFVEGLGGFAPIFQRIAVTDAQIKRLNIPTKPNPKSNERLGRTFQFGVAQAEAIEPPEMARIVVGAIEAWMRLDVLEKVKRREAKLRRRVIKATATLGTNQGDTK